MQPCGSESGSPGPRKAGWHCGFPRFLPTQERSPAGDPGQNSELSRPLSLEQMTHGSFCFLRGDQSTSLGLGPRHWPRPSQQLALPPVRMGGAGLLVGRRHGHRQARLPQEDIFPGSAVTACVGLPWQLTETECQSRPRRPRVPPGPLAPAAIPLVSLLLRAGLTGRRASLPDGGTNYHSIPSGRAYQMCSGAHNK